MFCKNCGKEMSSEAHSCPHCGQPNQLTKTKSKGVFVLLGLIFGGVGAHRFYLGDTGLGLLYVALLFINLLFTAGLLTLIIAPILLIEIIVVACGSRKEFGK